MRMRAGKPRPVTLEELAVLVAALHAVASLSSREGLGEGWSTSASRVEARVHLESVGREGEYPTDPRLPTLSAMTDLPPALTSKDVEDGALSDAFWHRYEASSVDQQLVLARAAVEVPDFTEDEAFELGSELRDGLEKAGRLAEFDALLDAWGARRPEVFEDPYLQGWRVEQALRGRGGSVGEALLQLAKVSGDSARQLELYVEWALYRGHLKEAHAALQAAWPAVRDDEDLLDWAYEAFASRVVLTALDVALTEDPTASEEVLLARATPEGEKLKLNKPAVRQTFQLRTGRVAWQPPEAQVPRPSADELGALQRGLVMALELHLRQAHGWPLSRTQLLLSTLLEVMPKRPKKEQTKKGEKRKAVEMVSSLALLLPAPERIAQWAREEAEEYEERVFHPHAHGAVALALLPLGEFLREKGLMDAAQEAEWARKVRAALTPLPPQLEEDPELVEEVRRVVG